ncbi:cytochrome P450 family protein [Streptantibioticus ferralitis]|uniref:Cytochrome P450 n=1 Tax=Streptantibioticus ferralitis TaxID=236510 RepID=A0ABT5YXX4_9ACTN|nr:cytochrome P450 [Streptantibioticus ferralitis]MDF2256409.1 cytochrome P450 [Streptantibioticus ferralitis]
MDTSATPAPFVLDPARRDLHAENARLRALGPLVPVELVGGVRAWAVTRYETLQTVLTDARISKNIRHWRAWTDGTVPADWPLTSIVAVDAMTTADGADHRRLRALVSQAFTPRRVEALRPRVIELTAQSLDRLAELPSGPVDLRQEFAYPLPLNVICELIGLPQQRRDELHMLTNVLLRVVDTPSKAAARIGTLHELLGELIALRRREPGDDLTSALIAVRDEDGTRLSESELFGTVLLMFIAGHETSLNLITNAVRALLGHPDQLSPVRGGSRPWSAVVEETLRWDSPVAHFPMRYATEDLEIDGVRLHKGDAILASYTATGRDPAHYGERADRFDVAAPTPRHLAFGHGAHYCLGAQLARLEAEVALPALFDRFPELGPAVPLDELEPLTTVVSNSTSTLPVLLGAQRSSGRRAVSGSTR